MFNRIKVRVTILGAVGHHMVRFDETIRVPKSATVSTVLKAAGKAAGVDLLQALEDGAQPSILLDGTRLDDITLPIHEGAHISWLMPMAGG